jgi:hypothetical protein
MRDSGMRSALDRGPREPGLWQRIQGPLDRSTGRITDEQTYETERLQRLRDERFGQVVSHSEFEHFQAERERRLRIEDRARREHFRSERERRLELDRREYELFLSAALSPNASQAAADEQALNYAKARRDEQLIDADNRRAESLRQQPQADRARIDAEHQARVREIRGQYERERATILGVEPAPATQPAH